MSKGDILISVRPKFVERIASGEKAAELRRRAPRIQPGCRVWIYTKAPLRGVLKRYGSHTNHSSGYRAMSSIAILEKLIWGAPSSSKKWKTSHRV